MKNLFTMLKVHADTGQTFAKTGRHDPYKKCKFLVEITGNMLFAKAGFQKVSGLKMTTEVTEYREGGDNNSVHKSPGLTKYEPITLERGMSEDLDMWDFAVKALEVENPDFKAIITIKLQDTRTGKVVKTWEVSECWVSEYETGDFDAMSSDVMIERIVVQNEGFRLV